MANLIKCSDYIPLPNTPVLVTDEIGNVFISYWDEYESWNTVSKITHWQALPEPPKEGQFMEDSLFLFLGGLGDAYTPYTRENPPKEID